MDHILLHDNDNGTHYPSYTLLCKDQPLLPSKSTSFLLRLMPLGNSMDMGKGYDDMIGCATCNLSQRLMQ